ncbi:MAG: M15 family metallopeptidase [Clostridia bacterium]|nr:M15 family metallopeptidase [Clostridia bacterium]
MKKHRRIVFLFIIVFTVFLFACNLLLRQTSVFHHGPDAGNLPWNLTLVNKQYAVPKSYSPQLMTLSNGQRIDKRIYPDLQAMFDKARSQGLDLQAAYGYRTKTQQDEILQDRINALRKEGLSKRAAREEAELTVALPDHSEHQLGLAIDIQAKGDTDKDRLYTWLENNAYLYGFILRYPPNRTDETGFEYERWHYRYVGKEAANIVFHKQLTLEEYLQKYK